MEIYPSNAVLMAPLSGYTDLPFRRSVRRCGCRFAFTEMIDASALVFARARTERMLIRGEDEPWLGTQLVTNDPEHLKHAVLLLNEYNFDVVDFNLGCPVPKVAKKGAGAALGANVSRAIELFSIIAEHSNHPVTAKIRILDENSPESTLELVQGLANAGARAITIHGRIAKRFYSGDVAFNFINLAAKSVNIPIIANGGIMGQHSFQSATEQCDCSRYMVARGAMGNPWILSEIGEDIEFIPPTIEELLSMLQEHVFDMLEFYGEEKGICIARKIMLDYLRGRGFNGEWRGSVGKITTKAEFVNFLNNTPAHHSEDYWKNANNHSGVERLLRKN